MGRACSLVCSFHPQSFFPTLLKVLLLLSLLPVLKSFSSLHSPSLPLTIISSPSIPKTLLLLLLLLTSC